MIGRRQLKMEVHGRIHVTHMVGYPNAQLYVSLRNVGRRPVRVSRITLTFSHASGNSFTVPSQQHFVALADAKPVLLVPTTLISGEEWGHVVVFFTPLSQQEERHVAGLRAALRRDLFTKINARERIAPEDKSDLEADPVHVEPLLALFRQHFPWLVGEFNLVVRVESDGPDLSQRYRFTVFEAEEQELRSYTESYKFGYGVAFDSDRHLGMLIPLFPN